jgi:hypothetical protein
MVNPRGAKWRATSIATLSLEIMMRLIVWAAPYPDTSSMPHQRAKEAKDWLLKSYVKLATDFCADRAPHADPGLLASQLFIVHEGMIAGALSGQSNRFAFPGATLVETLLDAIVR